MECLSPILSNTTRHGRIWLPCSKCIACKQRSGRDWFIRLKKHYEAQKNPSYFVTLTYDDLNLPYDIEFGHGTFNPDHVRKFVMQIRNFSRRGIPKKFTIKNYVKYLPTKISYFTIAERGDLFGRPHYHIIFFGVPFNRENFDDIVKQLWPYGRTDVGEVNDKSVCYITDYQVTKDNEKVEWRVMSKGIGEAYVNTHKKFHKAKMDFKVPVHDRNFNMPRYYRKKIFNTAERTVIGKKIQKEVELNTSGEEYHIELQKRIDNLTEKIRIKREKRNKQRWQKYNKSQNET